MKDGIKNELLNSSLEEGDIMKNKKFAREFSKLVNSAERMKTINTPQLS